MGEASRQPKAGSRAKGLISSRTAVLLLAALALAALVSVALAADTLRGWRADSAHGDTTFGVNRTSLPNAPVQVYATGNCAHCHEQHGLVGGTEPAPTGGSGPYAVFAAGLGNTDNFCLNCHGGMYQSVTNRNYSYRFGGFAANPVTSISQAFGFEGAGGSAHTLATIGTWAYAIGGGSNQHEDWGFVRDSSGQNATNPCLACHDVHRAMRTTTSADPAKAAITLPVAHNQADTHYQHLWGDDREERQDLVTLWHLSGGTEPVAYQSPFRYPAPSTDPPPGAGSFEPDGSATIVGSNTPNYTEQCLACHRKKATGVRRIRWDETVVTKSVHGLAQENHPQWGTSTGDLKPPYVLASWDPTWAADPKRSRNYIVGCLDCHEPHGSRLPYLLREEVNGWAGQSGAGIVVPGPGQWLDFCKGCHDVRVHFTPDNPDCSGCHGHQEANEQPARLF